MKIAKWYYLIGFTATLVATWALRDYGGEWLAENVYTFRSCRASSPPPSSTPSMPPAPPPSSPMSPQAVLSNEGYYGRKTCGGIEIALRVSFANCCFFALHFLASLGMRTSDSPRLEISHAGLWIWRTAAWIGALIGFFFVPAEAVHGYGQFARGAGAVWLVLQMIMLVLLAYEINKWLLKRHGNFFKVALVVLTVVCIALSLALIAIGYRWYAPHMSCRLNIFFVTITLIAGLAMAAILAVPNRSPSSGLLTSMGVWLYCSYLMYSALSSEPVVSNGCRRGTGSNPYWVPAVAFALALAALLYSTFSAGLASDDLFPSSPSAAADIMKASAPGDASSCPLPYRADLFHFVFLTASAYAGMLFSSWRLSGGTEPFELDVGWASTWAKMGAKWLCEVIYLWTVVAPAIFRNRDFSNAIWNIGGRSDG